jgi:phosphoglycolate phosphatase
MAFFSYLMLFSIVLINTFLVPGCSNVPQNNDTGPKIKMIIFDFDGTLADTLQNAISVINSFSENYGYKKIKDEAIPMLRDKPMKKILSEDLNLSFYQLPGFRHKLLSKLETPPFIAKIKIFEGISEVLEKLAQKYTLSIVTSNKSTLVDCVLKNNGIKTIKHIHSDSSIFGKHFVIKRLLKKMNLMPNEVVYVGDEVRDIEACQRLRMKIIAVTWGFNSHKLLESYKPDYLVDSPDTILTVFNGI